MNVKIAKHLGIFQVCSFAKWSFPYCFAKCTKYFEYSNSVHVLKSTKLQKLVSVTHVNNTSNATPPSKIFEALGFFEEYGHNFERIVIK